MKSRKKRLCAAPCSSMMIAAIPQNDALPRVAATRAARGTLVNIAVCIKQVVDTEAEKQLNSGSWCLDRNVNCILNPYDEYAVEEALRLKEAQAGAVTVVCMGPEGAEEAIRKALAMGADAALLVSDPALAGTDAPGTAHVLAAALRGFAWDVVLFGCRSTDGETGVVPAAVAEYLGVPLLSYLSQVEVHGSTLAVRRETDDGYVAYECPLPAVLSVVKGINEPRYPSMKGIMTAKRKPIEVKDAAALGLDVSRLGLAGAGTRVLSASVPAPRGAGVTVEDDGAGAQKIADFLAGEKLVQWRS
jgi:electron transfer flavoprotein beta subunit